MSNAYASLTDLKSAGALNITVSALDARLLALLEEVSRWIDTYCNRHFYVLVATRHFDGDGGREIHVPDLISVASLKSDEDRDRIYEVTWDTSDYLLYPLNAEPGQPWGRPFTRVVVDEEAGARAAFPRGKSVVEIGGEWGFRKVTVDTGADIDEGALLSASDTTLTVTDGSSFAPGQTLLIEDEQLYVTAVSANDLTVARGQNGTAAASHPDGSDISRFQYSGAVVEACLIQASRLWDTRGAALPAGQAQRTAGGGGLPLDPDVRQLLSGYRRRAARRQPVGIRPRRRPAGPSSAARPARAAAG